MVPNEGSVEGCWGVKPVILSAMFVAGDELSIGCSVREVGGSSQESRLEWCSR